jgi:hypothetical protein
VRSRARQGVEGFVLDSLKRHGGNLHTVRKNAVEVSFDTAPPFDEGGTRFVVAFERKALGHYPDARLAIQGSPFYLRLLDLARGAGGTARVFTPSVEPLPIAAGPPLIEGDKVTWTVGETAYHPHLVFNFAISYQSVVTSDDLISIGYDVVRDRFRDPAVVEALHSVWSETLAEPPEGWTQVPAPEPRSVLPRVLEVVDHRIHKKASRARRNTQRYLDREIQNVEDYYRQLIAEEKEAQNRLSNSSSSPKEASEREKRIRRYQLDWKRRIQEETRHHQCRVHIRLVSVAIVYMPRTALTVTGHTVTGTGAILSEPTSCTFNHFLGMLDGVTCHATGTERGPWTIDDRGRWVSRSAPEDDVTGVTDAGEGAGESDSGGRSERDEEDV